jgi:hypothetical protein
VTSGAAWSLEPGSGAAPLKVQRYLSRLLRMSLTIADHLIVPPTSTSLLDGETVQEGAA